MAVVTLIGKHLKVTFVVIVYLYISMVARCLGFQLYIRDHFTMWIINEEVVVCYLRYLLANPWFLR